MGDVADLRERVRAERRARGWSIRTAAANGGISNTAWGDWEANRRDIGDGVQAGIAQALAWPLNWPDLPLESLPTTEVNQQARRDEVEELRVQVGTLTGQVEELVERVTELGAEVVRLSRRGRQAGDGSS
jgi:transcriptional regulator with XRE-family HTH domain